MFGNPKGFPNIPTINLLKKSNGVIYLNPGSAGPRRFRLPVSIARAEIENGIINARIMYLL